jgi:hypothetical protein
MVEPQTVAALALPAAFNSVCYGSDARLGGLK